MRSRPVAKRLPADAEKLIGLSLALYASGSRIEDRFWEQKIDTLLARMLRAGHQAALDAALDHLQAHYAPAYGALADLAETQSESVVIEHDGQSWDVVLVAAPILVWTRFLIPSGPLKGEPLDALRNQFEGHLAASGSKVSLVPYLYSIDQLPRAHAEAFKLSHQLAKATVEGVAPRLSWGDLPESAPILADPRFLLAVIAAPSGEALFRWQDTDDSAPRGQRIERAHCLEQWRAQASPVLASILAGCEFECLLPDAYHSACRDADERIRPHTIRTAVRYLEDTLQTEAKALRAVIGGFGEQYIDEYRIGFTLRGANDVLYGVIWPLYGRENGDLEDGEEESEVGEEAINAPLETIVTLLRECGITDIRRLNERFDPEYCEDCGVPLYPDPHGDIVHAEMPEDAAAGQQHFH
ncbi:hypothetical protein WM40_07930 [Robbsia andropogonis]|uniref:DUF2863 domain-containing protein n=1 Tax=Robbsia andropogonis TaxID=28092 RepID=A0A0F5K244_9BURK|nr:DUF2863 family protein [Robbsia andropogonis]KKB64005.1 hypothetical protein WM40_07930 [Robbsia andropogonis]MCP1119850.1 DUF2863 family protein [Robbsia andropogonis]MCP1128883.1 DUF2863 family protein [Robbsia andropogonis]